jgi:hypothetical protein
MQPQRTLKRRRWKPSEEGEKGFRNHAKNRFLPRVGPLRKMNLISHHLMHYLTSPINSKTGNQLSTTKKESEEQPAPSPLDDQDARRKSPAHVGTTETRFSAEREVTINTIANASSKAPST